MKKRLRATSLVEILIVLAIISSTILGSMLLVSNSFVVVRQNQTEDYVNGLVINAMEIVKSPANVLVTDTSFTQSATPSYFKLAKANIGNSFYLQKVQDQQISGCTSASQYLITADSFKTTQAGASPGQSTIPLPPVCVQVRILPVNSVGGQTAVQSYYQLNIIAIYQLDSQPITINFQSNRYEAFKLAPGTSPQ